MDRLSECVRHRLTMVSASAGSGKTTLLAQWRASPAAQQHAVGWLSLDRADDDPARFFGNLAAAVDAARPGVAARALALLRASPCAPHGEVLASLVNDLAGQTGELVLVLDDYHLVRSSSIHDAMERALCRLPGSVHLVVAARSTPPLPLPLLRARGELLEIRPADLRFTMEEATAFLEGTESRLSPGFAESLALRAEGWGAGLRLAALSVLGREAPEPHLAPFSGTQRFLLDFFGDEVLQREPTEVQAFLLRTSILGRLCGPLCDAVSSGRGARAGSRGDAGAGQRMLERVERENLFLIPLDEERRWWRYHRLFGEFLQRRLLEERREEIPELHRKAGLWLEANGFTAAAAGHAVEVGDFERAARLLDEAMTGSRWTHRAYSCLVATPPSALLRWLGALPEPVARSRPSLRLMEAWALLQIGQVEAAEARFGECIRASPRDRLLDGQASALYAYLAVVRGEGRSALRLASRALRRLPRNHTGPRVMAHLAAGMAHGSRGSVESAGRELRRAQAFARPGDGMAWLYSTAMLGDIELGRGELREAARLYEDALRQAPWGGEWAPAPAALPNLRLGWLSFQWNDLDSAARHLDVAIEVGNRSESGDYPALASMLLGHVREAQGQTRAARHLAERTEKLLRSGTVVSPWSANIARALLALLWLRQGDLDRAGQWANSHDRSAGIFAEDRAVGEIAWARIMLSLGRADEVVAPLQAWLRAAQAARQVALALELEALSALALAGCGELKAAQERLQEALAHAKPEGWIRLFLDGGEPMARLLERAARRCSATSAYARSLLAAFPGRTTVGRVPLRSPGTADNSLVEPLSKRELEVLSFIGDGLTNPEIAERLSVKVGTAKTHIHNLYGKLGARSRTDALARARRLGVI